MFRYHDINDKRKNLIKIIKQLKVLGWHPKIKKRQNLNYKLKMIIHGLNLKKLIKRIIIKKKKIIL